MPNGRWETDRESPGEERAGLEAILVKLDIAAEEANEGSHEAMIGPLVDWLLLRRGIVSVDADTRLLLLDACARGLRDAFASRKRNLEGDYSADPKEGRFPPFERSPEGQPTKPLQSSNAYTSLASLVEDWWKEARAAGRKPSTYESYRNTAATLVAFLKHDDASRMTAEDVIAFKEHRHSATNPRTGKPIL